jgi:hypothetical protein
MPYILNGKDRNIFSGWMKLAKHNKQLQEASALYYKKFAEILILSSIVLGNTGSILNIILGALDPFSFVIVNVAQIILGASGLVATVIITASKQLKLEANTLHHIEHASKYVELYRTARAELVLIRLNDSSYASKTDFLKHIEHELDRIELNAPTIPNHIERNLGPKCIASPNHSQTPSITIPESS